MSVALAERANRRSEMNKRNRVLAMSYVDRQSVSEAMSRLKAEGIELSYGELMVVRMDQWVVLERFKTFIYWRGDGQ